MFRTSNPALTGDIFSSQRGALGYGQETMTVQGTTNKAFILATLLLVTAAITWSLAFGGNPTMVAPLTMVGTFGGMIVAFVTIFKKTWAPVTAPIYAALEGLALGGISTFFEMRFPGIAVQSVGLTMAVFMGMLVAYKTGAIQASDRFKRGLFSVTAGIAIFYLIQMVLGFFGVRIPMIHEAGPIGIGFSLVISAVAAFNLIVDFDFIESGARQRAPEYMEWYAAFSLLVTLVWLYMEILRLVSKLRSRN